MTGYIGIGGTAKKIKNIYIGIGGVAKQVKKGYIGVGGVARLWYSSALEITYSGSYTDEIVTMDGSTYRLLTLTSSGTFAASAAVTGDIWICGGGGSGNNSRLGGGGGCAATANNQMFQNLTIVIGTGGVYDYINNRITNGGNSSISGDVSLSANGGHTSNIYLQNDNNGGSGGGGGGSGTVAGGSGDGVAKTPFASSYFSYPYCDGGGGAGYYNSTSSKRRKGGVGGTNGGNGGSNSSGGYTGGAGGGHYGGRGANAPTSGYAPGAAATGYGSGSGGSSGNASASSYKPGDGYQGVCFIRIPAPGATPDPGPEPLSDLTGTTWYFNDTLSIASADYATYSINFTYTWGATYNATSLQINGGYGYGSMLYNSTTVYNGSPNGGSWVADRTISITGGTDATNATLIAWLQANATQMT